jgi:hypothetical protein
MGRAYLPVEDDLSPEIAENSSLSEIETVLRQNLSPDLLTELDFRLVGNLTAGQRIAVMFSLAISSSGSNMAAMNKIARRCLAWSKQHDRSDL